ncbi:polysaccharide pyruvyl transferase family protein [Gordonia shandongensis]|uniref:polysaccharide pyruvyl transferase family protein n=1 Tax=Gordonia shandongensis TaxID=376351 RepID=UPI000423391C|nr:polysaccharide pyruvyl transferase family protein [Gordonia shandongensis]
MFSRPGHRPLVPALIQRAHRVSRNRDIVYLVTTAGHPNFGDELIVEAWLSHLAAHRPFARVIVDSPRPGQAALLLRHANRRAVFVDTLWRLTLHAAGDEAGAHIDRDAPWAWVAEAASTPGTAPRESEGVELLLAADTIHLVGGGFINNVWPHHVSLVSAIAAAADVSGARAVATGAGFTPAVEGPARERLLADLGRFDSVDVRDRPTAELVSGLLGVTTSGDDAWLSRRVTRRPRAADPTGRVTLCIQSDLTDDFHWDGHAGVAGLAAFVAATLDSWRVDGRDVTVVEAIPGHDVRVAEMLGERLADARRVPFMNVWRNGLPVGIGTTWISTRFHPHLLAAAAGDSGVAVVGRPDYYSTKHQSLVDAGSAWTVIGNGRDIPPRPTAGGFTPDAAAAHRASKRRLAAQLYPAGVRLR